MMHPIEGLANETVDYISDQVKDNPEIDLKTTINGFALDSISKGPLHVFTKNILTIINTGQIYQTFLNFNQ